MDLFLLITGFMLTLLGIVGSFLPVIPGPITGWVGLLVLHLTKIVPISYPFLIVTFVIAVTIFILDYIIPAMGTKRFGGSKHGAYGTTIGLLIGLFSPIPFGFIIGAFAGALIGELVYDRSNISRAIKAAFGAFLGFLASTSLKFLVAFVFMILYLVKFWEVKDLFFV